MTESFQGHNVPPWDYTPQPVFTWELREGHRVISSGASRNLNAIAAYLAQYILPPRFDTIFRLWDMQNQLILGWCNSIRIGEMDILGVKAVFDALSPHADPIMIYDMAWAANPKAYIHG